MIKINQIKLPVTHSDEALKKKIIKMLKLNAKTGFTYRILKKSLDAVLYIFSCCRDRGYKK